MPKFNFGGLVDAVAYGALDEILGMGRSDNGIAKPSRYEVTLFPPSGQQGSRGQSNNIFSKIDPQLLHSVSLGSFRLPKDYFKKLEKLYPDELLLASPLSEDNGMVSYPNNLRNEMLEFCENRIRTYAPDEKLFSYSEVV